MHRHFDARHGVAPLPAASAAKPPPPATCTNCTSVPYARPTCISMASGQPQAARAKRWDTCSLPRSRRLENPASLQRPTRRPRRFRPSHAKTAPETPRPLRGEDLEVVAQGASTHGGAGPRRGSSRVRTSHSPATTGTHSQPSLQSKLAVLLCSHGPRNVTPLPSFGFNKTPDRCTIPPAFSKLDTRQQ